MRKSIILLTILGVLPCVGCTIPTSANYSEIYSFTHQEKKVKGMMGSKRKIESIRDFRENEMYIEDITALKEDV